MVTSRICGANDDHSEGLVNRPQTVSGRAIPLASTNMLSSLTDPTNQCSLRISATCPARPPSGGRTHFRVRRQRHIRMGEWASAQAAD